MPDEYEFATVDSDKELIVHLAVLHEQHPRPEELNVHWLCSRLHIEHDDVFAALALEGNSEFVASLYATLQAKWPRLDLTPPDVTWLGAPPADDDALVLPDSVTSDLPTKIMWLGLLARHAQPLWDWPLPAVDLFLPLPDLIKRQLAKTTKPGGRRTARYGLTPLQADAGLLEKLIERRDALLATIELTTRKHQVDHSRIVVLHKIRNLLELERHNWRNLDSSLTASADALWAIEDLDDAVRDVMEAATEALAKRSGQAEAADKLLAMFDLRGDGAALVETLRNLADHPGAYPGEFVEKLSSVLTECMHMLAQSERHREFVRDHWLPLLEGACEELPESVEQVFADLDDPDFDTVWNDGWKEDLAMLRLVFGKPSQTTALEPLATLAKTSKWAMGAIAACASDSVVLYAFRELDLVATSGSSVFATVGMRLLAAGAVEHRIANTPMLSRRVALIEFLRTVRGTKGAGSKDWYQLGKELNESYAFADRFKAWQAGIGINIIAALVMLRYALADDEEEGWIRLFNFSSGFLSARSSYLAAQEGLALLASRDQAAKELSKRARLLGGVATALGTIVSTHAAYVDFQRGNAYGVTANSLAAVSGGLTLGGIMLAGSYLGAVLTGAGIVYGAVALAMVVLGPGKGPAAMAGAYWRHALGKDSPLHDVPEPLRERVKSALSRADPHLVDLEGGTGEAGKGLELRDPPTAWAAHELGFERAEIETLFQDGDDLVEGFELPAYKEPID